ncbi:MAG: hypothetical protein KC776_12345 [Myxococcales bacterium]|nr:hypothetical protein [Myxococcales bacterium]MCB9580982.1 hypothetical protein [Polyangiaceae bacterium]
MSGGGLPVKWDAAKGYGTTPGTKLVGFDLQRFQLRILYAEGINGLSSFEQRYIVDAKIRPLLETTLGGKVAVDFYHPAVSEAPINIRSVVLENWGQLEPADDTGLWVQPITLLKFSKPKVAIGKPKASKNSASKQPTAQDAADKDIAALTETLNKVAEGKTDIGFLEALGVS